MTRFFVFIAMLTFVGSVSLAQEDYEGSFTVSEERVKVFSSPEGDMISINEHGETVKRYRNRTLRQIAEAEGGKNVTTAAQEAARDAREAARDARNAQRDAAEARAAAQDLQDKVDRGERSADRTLDRIKEPDD